ncbi:hypothetical protein BaRGS_00002454 [Batillaria attramentaria]|uniref:Uncharacterized protein n=1 Tax=Batillaria attramentaria TaxID=370345 RepID=A0ABD0M3R3_9CAEN
MKHSQPAQRQNLTWHWKGSEMRILEEGLDCRENLPACDTPTYAYRNYTKTIVCVHKRTMWCVVACAWRSVMIANVEVKHLLSASRVCKRRSAFGFAFMGKKSESDTHAWVLFWRVMLTLTGLKVRGWLEERRSASNLSQQ